MLTEGSGSPNRPKTIEQEISEIPLKEEDLRMLASVMNELLKALRNESKKIVLNLKESFSGPKTRQDLMRQLGIKEGQPGLLCVEVLTEWGILVNEGKVSPGKIGVWGGNPGIRYRINIQTLRDKGQELSEFLNLINALLKN